MSIDTKLLRLNEVKSEIRSAIEEKGQIVDNTDTFYSYGEKIRQIQSGGSTADNNITFYDYDGTVLYSYTLQKFANMTEMPVAPAHERLIFQKWNWTIDDIKAMGRAVNVGAVYTTASGNSELDIKHTVDVPLNLTLHVYNVTSSNTITINWGDGVTETSDTSSGLKTFTHSYTTASDYMIAIDGTGAYYLGGSPNTNIFNSLPSTPSSFCTAIRLGDRCDRIPDYGFRGLIQLVYTVIPDGVTSIGANAFSGCYTLQSIVIPDGVTRIETNAFSVCHTLQSIVIPNGVTSIGTYAFSTCYNLQSIVIPDSVASIGASAFSTCHTLQSIVIPCGVTSIESALFQNCYTLQSIVIPDGVTSISYQAFSNCSALQSIVMPNGVTSIMFGVFQYCYTLQNIVISDNVTNIENSAFYNCYGLRNIVIPDSVTSIGTSAFQNCYNLLLYKFLPTTPPAITNMNVFSNIHPDSIIEVPKGTLQAYQTASYWSTYASRMREAAI